MDKTPHTENGELIDIPKEWTFENASVAKGFDHHVREQLPWYDLVTGAVAHIARHYIPQNGLVYDIGASTGNIGKALEPALKQRRARLMRMRDLFKTQPLWQEVVQSNKRGKYRIFEHVAVKVA